jgi:post-segregation antitoxin (ccd killing protein)
MGSPEVMLVCILCGVTRLNVYLPDDLAAQAKEAGLNLSAVTQEAVRQSLAARSTDSWLASALQPVSTSTVTHDRALEAIDDVRDEASTRHG